MSDLYSTEDLRHNFDAIMERVRSGVPARIYDPEGFDLTLTQTEQLASAQCVAQTCATLLVLLTARGAVPGAEMTLADYGDWPWLRHLDSHTLDEFLGELTEATVIAARDGDHRVLQRTLDDWRSEAEAIGAATPRTFRRRAAG